jgi:hypothetical protein
MSKDGPIWHCDPGAQNVGLRYANPAYGLKKLKGFYLRLLRINVFCFFNVGNWSQMLLL